jgi:hypothetical protein
MFDMTERIRTGLNLLDADNVNSLTSSPLHFECLLATSVACFSSEIYEKLIELVRKCEELYNVSNKKYSDRVWKEKQNIIGFLRGPSPCVLSNTYFISTVNTQHMQRPDILLQLGYTWRHVSAIKRPSSGHLRIISLRYSQNCCPVGSHCLH